MSSGDVSTLLSNAIEAMPLPNFVSPIFTHGSLLAHAAFGKVPPVIREAAKEALGKYRAATSPGTCGKDEEAMQQILSQSQELYEYCMLQKQRTVQQVVEGQYLLLKTSTEVRVPCREGTFLLFHCDRSGAMRCSTLHDSPLNRKHENSKQSGAMAMPEDVDVVHATMTVIEDYMAVPPEQRYTSSSSKGDGVLHCWVSNSYHVASVQVVSGSDCQCGFIFTVFGALLFHISEGAVKFFRVVSGEQDLLRGWWISLTRQRQEQFQHSAQDTGLSIAGAGAAVSVTSSIAALAVGVHAIWLAPLLATTGVVGLSLVPVGLGIYVMFCPVLPNTTTLQSAEDHPVARLRPMAPTELPVAFAWKAKTDAEQELLAESFNRRPSSQMKSIAGEEEEEDDDEEAPVGPDIRDIKDSVPADPPTAANRLYHRIA